MSKNKENKAVVETVEETTSVETVVEAPIEKNVSVYIGKIRNCDKLNVRAEPNLNAKIVCKLDKNSEVRVEKSESAKEFYKVYVSPNVSGYCMKKYMSTKKSEA
jgi:uncharacterized protein YgiM (DUF1202 family)